jgi:hypothetical protein
MGVEAWGSAKKEMLFYACQIQAVKNKGSAGPGIAQLFCRFP